MWEERLQQLLAFRRDFGHVEVPRAWPDNPPLARWVINLRRQVRTGTILPERRRRLDELRIRWPSADERRRVRDRSWDLLCDALASFRRDYGHCEVRSNDPAHPKLGPWLARQRHLFRAGLLREDRLRRLEDAGIEWTGERGRSQARDGEWDRMFESLSVYQREHGDCRVPKGWAGNPKLARWVVRQRHYFRTRALRPDRRARLEELGWGLSPAAPRIAEPSPGPRERAWRDCLKSLEAFRQTHGHCSVPRRWPWNRKLARWVHYQRDLRRRGLLNREHAQLLDALGFQWLGKTPSPASVSSQG